VSTGADRALFWAAPLIGLTTVGLAALFVPLDESAIAVDSPVGIFFFLVLLSPAAVALLCAGWSANGTPGLFGAFRAAAQLVAYEVPLGFAAIGPAMAAQSLSPLRIVEAQHALPFALWQPLGLGIYLAIAPAVAYRHPFDLPQAASELAGGVLADASGPRLLLLRFMFAALFALLMVVGAILFLGGWRGPLLPGPVWLLLKALALAIVIEVVGTHVPRLRQDQLLAFSWKVLLPASLLHIAVTGVLALLIPAELQ
jgi:NADH-quinone oxidoreductase subunit H